MELYCGIKGKIASLILVGHFPREISRLCKYFLGCNSELDVTVFNKVPQKPITTGGLEISIKPRVGKRKASLKVFIKMKSFGFDDYLEPEKISLDVKTEEEEEEFFVTFQFFFFKSDLFTRIIFHSILISRTEGLREL